MEEQKMQYIALPLPVRYHKRSMSKRKGKIHKEVVSLEENPTAETLILALEDFSLVVNNVMHMIGDSECSKKVHLTSWLQDIMQIIKELQDMVNERVSLDDTVDLHEVLADEAHSLDDILSNTAFFSESFEDHVKPRDVARLLSRVIEFWSEEIKRRGYQLYNFMINAEDTRKAIKDLKALREIRFP